MKICEIENKFFQIDYKCILILEAYANPDQELEITFSKFASAGYYSATVEDKSNNDMLITIIFTLNQNGTIDVGNIIPADNPRNNKLVHTSFGNQNNGADIGTTGMRWVMRQIKNYATAEGFIIKKIVSQTRYTGIRAKNNLGEDELGLPKNFDVTRQLKESMSYDCLTDEFIIVKS